MKFKNMISTVLTFAMVATMSLAVPVLSFADPTDEWDDSTSYYDTSWYTSSGTNFTLNDEEDIAGLAYLVNHGTSFEGKTVNIQTGTYDLSAHKWLPIGNATISSDSNTYSPVASGYGFDGTLDGNGASITGLFVTQATDEGAGFFGYITPKGKAFDLQISGHVYGSDDAVGGVTGYNSGLISGVSSSVVVSASNSYNVGGIAGFNNNYYGTNHIGVISKCTNSGAVTGYQKVGGIAGENAGFISRCSNSARIIGSNTSSKNGVGGIAGRNGNNNTAKETGYIVNCYNTGTVGSSGQKWVGGITGLNNSKSYVSTCYSNVSVEQGSGYYNTIVGKQEGTSQYNYYVSDNGVTYKHSGSDATEIGSPSTGADLPSYLNAQARSLTPEDTSTDDPIWTTGTTPPAVFTSVADWFLSNAIASSDTTIYTNSCSVIYLQNGAGSTFDLTGNPSSVTVGDPYVAARLAAESTNSACYVSVLDSITIASEIQPIYDNVKFIWGASGSGPMFNINSGGSLIMAAKEVDGNTTCTTLFDVNGTGVLKLRGNVTTKNTTTSVDLESGKTFMLSQATIGGKIVLASNAYITLTNILSSPVTVQCPSLTSGTRVAFTSDEDVASNAVGKLEYYGSSSTSFTYSASSTGYNIKIS